MKLPEAPLSRKMLLNLASTMARGQLDITDEADLVQQIEAHQLSQPDDLAFRDELARILLWELARASRYREHQREQHAETMSRLRSRVDTLEAERGR